MTDCRRERGDLSIKATTDQTFDCHIGSLIRWAWCSFSMKGTASLFLRAGWLTGCMLRTLGTWSQMRKRVNIHTVATTWTIVLRESIYRLWFNVNYYLLPLVEYLPSRDALDADENQFYVRSGGDEVHPFRYAFYRNI